MQHNRKWGRELIVKSLIIGGAIALAFFTGKAHAEVYAIENSQYYGTLRINTDMKCSDPAVLKAIAMDLGNDPSEYKVGTLVYEGKTYSACGMVVEGQGVCVVFVDETGKAFHADIPMSEFGRSKPAI
jgi:hypothetical protein